MKENVMINPRLSASTILSRPECAEPLFDLLVWVSEQMKTASDRAILDEILEDTYAKTDDARVSRERYTRERLIDDTALTSSPLVRS